MKTAIIVIIIFVVVTILLTPKIKKFVGEEIDEQNEIIISNLHPSVRDLFRKFLAGIKDLGFKPLLTSGYRSFEKQKKLHAQNPSNAQAGFSPHNYGFAVDLNLISLKKNTYIRKADSRAKWILTGVPALAKQLGLRWGGDFQTYHDPVHFDRLPFDTAELRKRAIAQFGTDETKILGNKINIA